MELRDTEILHELAGHIGFEFDGAAENVHTTDGFGFTNFGLTNSTVVITEPGRERYAEFSVDTRVKPTYDNDSVDGIVDEDLDAKRWNWENLIVDPDAPKDQTLHGLLESREGHIALYSKHFTSFKLLDKLYRFKTTNAAPGANKTHQAVGRIPGVDIPKFIEKDNGNREFFAGEITEAIANMQMLAPGINFFGMVVHDLGGIGPGDHGQSWAHTHPAYFRNLSRLAQEVVEAYGSQRLHFETEEERANRPGIVIDIARALDNLQTLLRPDITASALLELRIRDGRYNELSDEEIVQSMLERSYRASSRRQQYQALGFEGIGETERKKRGYWISMQLFSGVLATRLALHEVLPHPEATDAHTRRTLDILSAVKTEVDSRVNDNREFALAD